MNEKDTRQWSEWSVRGSFLFISALGISWLLLCCGVLCVVCEPRWMKRKRMKRRERALHLPLFISFTFSFHSSYPHSGNSSVSRSVNLTVYPPHIPTITSVSRSYLITVSSISYLTIKGISISYLTIKGILSSQRYHILRCNSRPISSPR